MSTHLRRVFATGKTNETRARRLIVRPRLFDLEPRCTPTTFTVTTASDVGVGSLRQAIILANAAPGADVIDFDTALGAAFENPQTIAVSAALGELSISDHLTISGTGASRLTINATGSGGRVFSISGPDTIAVALSGMTITGGSVSSGDGGGINFDNENLTLDGVVVTGNSATGATDTSGGGVSDILAGTLTVRNSTISGNSTSGRGGGILLFNGGSLLLENSTVTGNTAADANGGGGVYFFGPLGPDGVLIRSSTITSNTAPRGGGVALRSINSGSVEIQNSTFVLNSSTTVNTGAGFGGGGIAVESGTAPALKLTNTLVSGNTASPANGRGDIAVHATATVNCYYCSIFDPDGFTLSASSTNNRAFGENPALDPNGLFTNGGPTSTIALLPTSPLVDTGPATQPGVLFDQRGVGYPRVSGAASDIGAFEIQVIAPPSVVSVLINGSNPIQRSRVTSLAVTFNTVISFATTAEAAFTIKRDSDLANVNFTATTSVNGLGQSVVVLSNFTDGTPGTTQFGSLADGRYRMTALAFQIRAGMAPLASDYEFGDAQGLYRFFGDTSGGDRRVDIADFGLMSLAYLTPANFNSALDFNNDGRVDIADFGQFSIRYFTSLP